MVDKFKGVLIQNSPADSFNIAGQSITIGFLACVQLVQRCMVIIGSLLVVIGESFRLVVSGSGQWLVKIGRLDTPSEWKKKAESVSYKPEESADWHSNYGTESARG